MADISVILGISKKMSRQFFLALDLYYSPFSAWHSFVIHPVFYINILFLLQAVMHWLYHDIENRKNEMGDLLAYIKLPLISQQVSYWWWVVWSFELREVTIIWCTRTRFWQRTRTFYQMRFCDFWLWMIM
jgi:BTB And C-terminal Kelch.